MKQNLIPVVSNSFILMDYSIHIHTIIKEWSIMHFKGLPVKLSIKLCIYVPEDCFFNLSRADPDEMPLKHVRIQRGGEQGVWTPLHEKSQKYRVS